MIPDPPRGEIGLYRITLRPLPGYDVPAEIRLKAALRVLLRRFGFRCVGLETPAEEAASWPVGGVAVMKAVTEALTALVKPPP